MFQLTLRRDRPKVSRGGSRSFPFHETQLHHPRRCIWRAGLLKVRQIDAAMMLRIAADYDRLAESADDRAPHDSLMFRTAEVRRESLPEIPSKLG